MLAFIQFPADFFTFAEEILNGKLHFLWSVRNVFRKAKNFLDTVKRDRGQKERGGGGFPLNKQYNKPQKAKAKKQT